MCLCLSEGETVRLIFSLRFNCSGTMKHLLLTHLSLNPSYFYVLFYVLSFYNSLQYTCFFFSCLLKSAIFYFLPPLCLIFSLFLCIPHCLSVMGILLPCLCFFFFFLSVLLLHICEICSRCSYNSI